MKKVLLVCDGGHFSHAAFEFIRQMNTAQKIQATGIFLPAINYSELLYSFGGIVGPLYYEEVAIDDTGILQKNIDLFTSMCNEYGIENSVHPHIEKHVVDEIKKESRYADILLISSDLFYKNMGSETQDDYIDNVLHRTECPVVLLPEDFHYPENIILTYDGSENSVFAIKQFAYLFPELTALKSTLIYAGTDKIPNLESINEFASNHYSNLEIFELKADPKHYFTTWLQDNKKPLLVSGSHGRSVLSEMFKENFITEIIHDRQIPVFVAHK